MSEEKKDLFSEADVTNLSNRLYNAVLNIRTTLTLPTHVTLFRSMVMSGIILLSSCVSTLLGWYTFIEPLGALLCFAVLLTLSIKERSEGDEISRMYSVAKLSADKIARRAKTASSGISTRRSANDSNRNKQKAGNRKRK